MTMSHLIGQNHIEVHYVSCFSSDDTWIISTTIRFKQSIGGGTVGAEELQTQLLKVTEGHRQWHGSMNYSAISY